MYNGRDICFVVDDHGEAAWEAELSVAGAACVENGSGEAGGPDAECSAGGAIRCRIALAFMPPDRLGG